MDEGTLKTAHKKIREHCVFGFRDKAYGQDTHNFEISLRQGITKKYQTSKSDLAKVCSAKAKEFLDEGTEGIKRKLQDGEYTGVDMVSEDLEQVKVSFLTGGPKFSGSQ